MKNILICSAIILSLFSCATKKEAKRIPLTTTSKEAAENFSQGLCIGIILGVEDNAHYDKKICVPKNVDIKERAQVVGDYVATQPNRMNEAFASLVFDALVQKWPCSTK